MSILDDIKEAPPMVWIGGAVVIVGGAFLLTRGGGAASGEAPSSDILGAIAGLTNAINNNNAGAGSTDGTSGGGGGGGSGTGGGSGGDSGGGVTQALKDGWYTLIGGTWYKEGSVPSDLMGKSTIYSQFKLGIDTGQTWTVFNMLPIPAPSEAPSGSAGTFQPKDTVIIGGNRSANNAVLATSPNPTPISSPTPTPTVDYIPLTTSYSAVPVAPVRRR
jgi:hypothetical protein